MRYNKTIIVLILSFGMIYYVVIKKNRFVIKSIKIVNLIWDELFKYIYIFRWFVYEELFIKKKL